MPINFLKKTKPEVKKRRSGFVPVVSLCALMIAITVTTAWKFLPVLKGGPYESAAGSTAGSIIGTLLAFLGALYLWSREQNHARENERDLRDKDQLRHMLAGVGTLEYLNLNFSNPNNQSVNREWRLASIRIDEAAAIISNAALREECKIIADFVSPDSYLEAIYGAVNKRIHIGHKWLLDLLTLHSVDEFSTARPKNYEEIYSSVLDTRNHYEVLEEQQDEYEDEQSTEFEAKISK